MAIVIKVIAGIAAIGTLIVIIVWSMPDEKLKEMGIKRGYK